VYFRALSNFGALGNFEMLELGALSNFAALGNFKVFEFGALSNFEIFEFRALSNFEVFDFGSLSKFGTSSQKLSARSVSWPLQLCGPAWMADLPPQNCGASVNIRPATTPRAKINYNIGSHNT
jgi:hypothetical protein